jgi:hypothetical protein
VLAFIISSSDLVSGPFAKESFHRIFKEKIEDLKIQAERLELSTMPDPQADVSKPWEHRLAHHQ